MRPFRHPAGRIALASFALLAATAAHADLGFPDYVKFPPQIQIDPDQALIKEDLAAVEFKLDKAGTAREFKGRHYARWFAYKPAAGEPKPGYDNGTEQRIGKAMQAVFAKNGWQVLREEDNKSAWTMKLVAGGKDVIAAVKMDGPQAQVHLELIEQGAAASVLALKPPAAKPEKIGAKDDFPYLAPWPGSKRISEGRDTRPMDVAEPGKGQEAQLVGQGVDTRSYQGPGTLSRLQFVGEYREALLKAGWQVLYPSAATVAEHGSLVAHYTTGGRDVWARIAYEQGASLTYSVADAGADDLAARLAKDCHVPLYGVFFDFNKATLKPESDPVLAKVAALMKTDAALKAEVQGHTDNVGGDDYNLKLSDARAASVRGWLASHGIDAARLTSRGYGKSQPVADNGSDEGRARNRRVELARLGCRK